MDRVIDNVSTIESSEYAGPHGCMHAFVLGHGFRFELSCGCVER